MVQCAIQGCSSRSDTQPACFVESAIHFHRFPRATLIRQKWLQAINKREAMSSARICSLHFKKENYYLTKQGFHRLTGGSVPEIKLPVREDFEASSSDEEKSNELPPESNISHQSQSQQNSTKEITPENGTIDNVSGLSNYIAHVEYVKDDTTDSSSDEEMSNVRANPNKQVLTKEITPEIGTTVNDLGSTNIKVKHGEKINGDTTDSSEDEIMSSVQPQEQSINPFNQCQQNNFKKITTNNGLVSSSTKPGAQQHKVKTLLERKLLKKVIRLQEESRKKMEAINCLLEQNRRLIDRNSFLEQALINSKKVT